MRILSIDSPFGRALALVADVAIVSMCITITALTVVPLGAGLAAGCAVVLQLVREEGSRPWHTFWRVFRASFGRATAGWMLWLALVGLSGYELWLLSNAETLGVVAGGANVISDIWQVGIISALLVLGVIAIWFFPIVGQVSLRESAGAESAGAESRCSFRACLRVSVLAALKYAPISLAAVALWAAPVVLTVCYPRVGAGLVFFYIVFIPAFTLYLTALMMDSRLAQLLEERIAHS